MKHFILVFLCVLSHNLFSQDSSELTEFKRSILGTWYPTGSCGGFSGRTEKYTKGSVIWLVDEHEIVIVRKDDPKEVRIPYSIVEHDGMFYFQKNYRNPFKSTQINQMDSVMLEDMIEILTAGNLFESIQINGQEMYIDPSHSVIQDKDRNFYKTVVSDGISNSYER